MTIKGFEELEYWQKAREFIKLIYELTKKNNKFRQGFELVSQLRRNTLSSKRRSVLLGELFGLLDLSSRDPYLALIKLVNMSVPIFLRYQKNS